MKTKTSKPIPEKTEETLNRLWHAERCFAQAGEGDAVAADLSDALYYMHLLVPAMSQPGAGVYCREAERVYNAAVLATPAVLRAFAADTANIPHIDQALAAMQRITGGWAIGSEDKPPRQPGGYEWTRWLRNYCHNLVLLDLIPKIELRAERERERIANADVDALLGRVLRPRR